MVAQSDFEYTYRWADGLDVDALEARDQALEQHLLEGYGSSCFVDFEYPYRWSQILSASSPAEQIQLLEHNMTALEHAVTAAGGCTLEFPFRWSQFWEALVAGESWAVGIAEENDRAIEFRFGRCSCIEGFLISSGSNSCELFETVGEVLAGSGTLVETVLEGNNSFGSWEVHLQLNDVTEDTITLPSGVFDFTEAISIPYVDSDVYTAELVSTFDFGANTITFTSASLDTIVTSNNITDTPIGSAFTYSMFLNRLSSPNSFGSTIDSDLQTVPGTDVSPPHAAVSNSLAFSSGDFFGAFYLDTDNPAAPTVSFDVTAVTLDFTKTGSAPMKVTLGVHQDGGGAGSGETTMTVTTAGSYSITFNPSPEGPFFGPPTGPDYNFIEATVIGQAPPCITNIVTQASGEGEDITTGWISA